MPMRVPPGIAYKVERAGELVRTLDNEVARYLRADPPPYRITTRDDPETRVRIYGLEVVTPPPAVQWGVVAGEIVHNMRSALDDLAYALCQAHEPDQEPPLSHGGQALRVRQARRPQAPGR
jgi:hypothetical protein